MAGYSSLLLYSRYDIIMYFFHFRARFAILVHIYVRDVRF